MRKEGRNRTKKQRCQPPADRPARQGGLSAMAARTVRQGTADWPHPCRGLSGPSHGPSVKANRTTRTDPRKSDRPRRPGGPSARATDRPLLKLGPSANRLQRKPKTKPDQTESKQEHEEHRDELGRAWTIRLVLADRPRGADRAENARPRKSTPPIHHPISQTVGAAETRVWGHGKHQSRMLYPKNFAS
jgi:hypothetical protein